MTISSQMNLPTAIQNILPLLKKLDVEQKLSLVHWLTESPVQTSEDKEDTMKLTLQSAIQEGLDSPRVQNFDFDSHLTELKKQRLDSLG